MKKYNHQCLNKEMMPYSVSVMLSGVPLRHRAAIIGSLVWQKTFECTYVTPYMDMYNFPNTRSFDWTSTTYWPDSLTHSRDRVCVGCVGVGWVCWGCWGGVVGGWGRGVWQDMVFINFCEHDYIKTYLCLYANVMTCFFTFPIICARGKDQTILSCHTLHFWRNVFIRRPRYLIWRIQRI